MLEAAPEGDNLQNCDLMRKNKLMQRLRFKIPTPNSLVTFEAAARHLSFTTSAAELNVTRVAVSQQIKALETFLGVRLFERLHRALRLTHAGERYYETVSISLERILAVTEEIRQTESEKSITVTTTTGFSTYWLLPRIGEFRKRYPDIDLRFLISDKYLDLHSEGVNVAIRYGEGNWDNLEATFLLQEEIFPTCSARYFAGRKPLKEPLDLLNETLLHLEGRYDSQTRWLPWFREHGLEMEVLAPGISVNTYTNLVQATLDGQGISLIGPPLTQRYLDDGTLVRPIEVPSLKRRAFYLALPKGQPVSASAQSFCNWIIHDSQAFANLGYAGKRGT
jgi:LysR family transcriptional regulator, glycine cleavage system transcriptional activator